MSTYNKFEVGSHIKCVYVDRYGFLGRDFHPVSTKDEGFDGIVVSAVVDGCCESGLSAEEMFPELPADPLYAYRVCRASDGKVLDLMSHEVADFKS